MDRLLSESAVLEAVSNGCREWRGIYSRCEENIKAISSTVDERVDERVDEAYSELCLLAAEGREAETIIHCKDCKYFEYDVVANVDGIPLIVAHEMCNKWGNGCKTSEDGYCFLAERKTEDEA